MNNIKISLCQYPTTSLFIDDNQDFLSEICLNLETKGYLCKSFSDPAKALMFLNDQYNPEPFTRHCTTTTVDRKFDQYTASFDIRKIHHEIYREDRFKQFSVIVVDYAMPIKNGIEFCRELKEPFALKMILTSEAGHALAVQAFNEGLINKFIEKGHAHITDVLLKSVTELQQKYFLGLTKGVVGNAAEAARKHIPACLSDTVFSAFFHKLMQDNHVVEYYLLDEHGSFLFLDADANPSWLIVKSEKDMHDVAQYAEDQEGLADIISDLKAKKVIPYFHTKEDWSVGYDEDKCREYLHPAAQLKGEQLYFYAYLKDSTVYKLERSKIVSFNQAHSA